MRSAIRFGLLALVLQAAVAQTRPDVAEILKKVAETYKAVSQYEFVVDLTLHDKEGGPPSATRMVFAFKAPNQYRMQGAIPGMSAGNPDVGEMLIVHDGSAVWFYFPKLNQYSTLPASELAANDPGDLGDLRPEAADVFMMGRYRGAADHTGGSKFLREESIEIAGMKFDCYVCYVVTVTPEGDESSCTWWIDRKRFRVLREATADSEEVFTDIKLDESLPDGLFKFNPPPGARKVEMRP